MSQKLRKAGGYKRSFISKNFINRGLWEAEKEQVSQAALAGIGKIADLIYARSGSEPTLNFRPAASAAGRS